MQIFQVAETLKMVPAYKDGCTTFKEPMTEMEWYRDKKIFKETKRSHRKKDTTTCGCPEY